MLLNASVSCREKVYPCTTRSSNLIRNYMVKTAKCNHICISDHLLAYEFTGSYHKWYDCHLLSLFNASISKQYLDENYVKIKRTLEREVRSCNALIIWTDCDRKGENIDFEIIQICQAVKLNTRVYR